MELWDIYDKDRNKTGRTIERGKPLEPGEYHLVVHIWMINSKGEFLIQKRAPAVKLAPGVWATTGGSAVVGDDSEMACLREAKEELGIDLNLKQAEVAFTYTKKDFITDVWVVRVEIESESLSLQVEEVSEARWERISEIKRMQQTGEFWNYAYLDELTEYIKKTRVMGDKG